MHRKKSSQALMRIVMLSRFFHLRRMSSISRVLDGMTRLLFSAAVPGRANIDPSVFFHHSGIGTVVNGASVIEEGCEIGVGVVLGGRAPLPGAPHLEAGVIVHAGAKLIGPIRIGEQSVVAANAVVLSDMPPRSLIAGVPATVRRMDISAEQYQTTSRDG